MMNLRTLFILFLLLTLLACSGPNTSKISSEKPENFTHNFADTQEKQTNVPMLPGKARLPAAPIQDANTQTSEKEVQPLAPPAAPPGTPHQSTPTTTTSQ